MTAQSQPQAKFAIRPANLEDLPFIYSSWLKSYRDAPAVRNIPNSIYYAEQHRLIERVVSSKNVKVYLACDMEFPEQIFGYIVGTPAELPIIHFGYVKHAFRNFGIGRALEKEFLGEHKGPVAYTQAAKNCERIIKSKDYIYNPYILWGK